MCLAATVVILAYIVLFLLARKESPGKVTRGVWKPFYCMALYLYKLACRRRLPIVGESRVSGDLERLHPTENKAAVCTDYYVEKLAKSLLIGFLGTMLGVVVSVKNGTEKILQEDGTIVRGAYGEAGKSLELEACLETGEKYDLSLQLEAKALTAQEAELLVREFSTRLPLLILGANPSLQEVTQNLCLEESYEGYPLWVEWHSSRLDLVSNLGEVSDIPEGSEQVILTARILYEEQADMEWEQEIPICVVARVLTAEEAFQRELEELLKVSERESRSLTEWKLPESIQETKITWKQRVTDYGPAVWGASLVVSVLIFFLADNDLHKDWERRRIQMKRAYPDVIQKLTLYMGAGLTVRGAFQKIAGSYEQEKKEGKAEKPIYEEMLFACRQLQAGVSEGVVYEQFGKRTGLQEYVRLSSLLTQNLKKGNSALLKRLREEVDKAYLEQLQNSRRLGEEASTKLLLPMVMLLAVVMLMIMIPAFSSVGA